MSNTVPLKLHASSKIQRALNVLNAIRLPDDLPADYWSVYSYQNGRENGFTVVVYAQGIASRAFSFSEARCSDEMVVYEYRNSYNPYSGGLTDEAYATAEYFGGSSRAGSRRAEATAARHITKGIAAFYKLYN